MYRISRELDFCYGHRLLNYQGKCRHLHGHNGRVQLTFEVPDLDELGMVFDFGRIKQEIGRWIDENLDHRMILHQDDPVVPTLRRMGEPLMLLDSNPTAENIARLIFEHARSAGLPVVECRLWETPVCAAVYCSSRDAETTMEYQSIAARCGTGEVVAS